MAGAIDESVALEDRDDDAYSLFGDDVDLDSLFSNEETSEPLANPSPPPEPQFSLPLPQLPTQTAPQPVDNGAPSADSPSADSPRASDAVLDFSIPSTSPQELFMLDDASIAAALSLPSAPDPLDALLSHRDGHTSGGLVVSTQNFAHDMPTPAPTPPCEDAGYDLNLDVDFLDIDALWNLFQAQGQPVNTQPEAPASQGESDLIHIKDLPGCRMMRESKHREIYVPRRIDHDISQCDNLAHVIGLRRETTIAQCFRDLELSPDTGKQITKGLRQDLQQPSFKYLIDEVGVTPLQRRKTMLRAAFHFLKSQDLGNILFSRDCPLAQGRTIFWPQNSTILLFHFTALLYRVVYSMQGMVRNKKKQVGSNESLQPAPANSQSLTEESARNEVCPSTPAVEPEIPIQRETPARAETRGDKGSATRSSPSPPAVIVEPETATIEEPRVQTELCARTIATSPPALAVESQSNAEQEATAIDNNHSMTCSPVPVVDLETLVQQLPLIQPQACPPTFTTDQSIDCTPVSAIDGVDIPTQLEALLQLGTCANTTTRTIMDGPRALFDSLIQRATAAKKRKREAEPLRGTEVYELEVPADALLTYHVVLWDGTDGSQLGPPATYRHTESAMAHGAFSYLKNSLYEAGETSPHFEITGPNGKRKVSSEMDWEQAVLALYNAKRSGNDVWVDVYI